MTARGRFLDRRALFSSAAAATLLAATGVSAAGQPRRGGRLRIALSGASRADTWQAGDGLFMQVARQGLVFDTLTEVAADGTLRGELATGWRANGDARVWEFSIRANVLFHDGAVLTAQDVAQSLQHSLPAAKTTALDHLTLRIALERPDVGLPLRLSQPEFVIYPAHAPDAGIGTGLYRTKRFSAGQRVLAERVKEHYKDASAGWFDEVELVSIPSETVRGQALGEYLVDAADLTDSRVIKALPDVVALPDAHQILQGVSRDVAQPTQISQLRPLDNLRAAERWWFA